MIIPTPLIPDALIAANYGGTITDFLSGDPLSVIGNTLNNKSSSKKAVAIESSGSSSGSSIFPEVNAAPFSIVSPTYDYSPSEQNAYHSPFEQFQNTYTDSRQFDITYPTYNYITDSNGAVITNKKESTLDNKVSNTPTASQSYTPTNTNDSGNSSGIDPLILIGGAALVLIALGGIAIVTK